MVVRQTPRPLGIFLSEKSAYVTSVGTLHFESRFFNVRRQQRLHPTPKKHRAIGSLNFDPHMGTHNVGTWQLSVLEEGVKFQAIAVNLEDD